MRVQQGKMVGMGNLALQVNLAWPQACQRHAFIILSVHS